MELALRTGLRRSRGIATWGSWPGAPGAVLLTLLLLTAIFAGPLQLPLAAQSSAPPANGSTPNAPPASDPQGAAPRANADGDLERLRAMLARSGPDGKEERESAVAQLLGRPEPVAHRLLQEQLLRDTDPDRLQVTILEALQNHLLQTPTAQFGGAAPDLRREILTGYLRALVPQWQNAASAVDDLQARSPRSLARLLLQRVPPRELDAAARVLLTAIDPAGQALVLRCLADMQQTLFAATIAEWLEAPDETVRSAAQEALQLLTYAEPQLTTRAQFDAWLQSFGGMRYIDLVERAARGGGPRDQRAMQEIARLKVESARDVVRALVVRTAGIDWNAVRERTISDDPAVLDACLELLQATLSKAVPPDESPASRQAFCRALLQRFQQSNPERLRRRALLLEVAAYLARPEETDLSGELVTRLLAQLDVPDVDTQVAALRSLRRFPSVETRTLLVQRALRLFPERDTTRAQLEAILQTLASRSAPRWFAPAADAADKAAWLELVDRCCRSEPQLALRPPALLLAQTLDPREQRVPEVFTLLLNLVQDPTLQADYRATCVLYLQDWRNEPNLAEQWLAAVHVLLADASTELRFAAAESLVRLPESTHRERSKWMDDSIAVLRDRLVGEPDVNVFKALVECTKVFGRQADMPQRVIGALNRVLEQISPKGRLAGQEHAFRVEPLLQALASVAADQYAERASWLGAVPVLIDHGQRQAARLVLQSHGAAEMVKDVGSADPSVADRARKAAQVIVQAAVLKPSREAWTSSEELRNEARDVRSAFAALDPLDERFRCEAPEHRVLRLEVEMAGGKFQEVVARAGALLQNNNGTASRAPLSPSQLDRVRQLAAEAHLALEKPEPALKLVEELSLEAAADPTTLELVSRIARLMQRSDAKRALLLFDRAWRGTSPEDPAFLGRLIEWARHRSQTEPDTRADTLRELTQFAARFAAPECPAELREAFDKLRSPR